VTLLSYGKLLTCRACDNWTGNEAALDQAKLFIAEIERRWDARLDALRRFVEE